MLIHCSNAECKTYDDVTGEVGVFQGSYGQFHCSPECRAAEHRQLTEFRTDLRAMALAIRRPAPAPARPNPVDAKRAQARAEVLANRAAPRPSLMDLELEFSKAKAQAAQPPANRERVMRPIRQRIDELETRSGRDEPQRVRRPRNNYCDASYDYIVPPTK